MLGAPKPRNTQVLMILVRSGQAAQSEGLCIGQTDLVLSPTGRKQIEALRSRCEGPLPDAIYASDLRRAREGADLFGEAMGMETVCDRRLRELDFGDWESRPWATLPQTGGIAFARWTDDFVHQRPPRGERFLDLAARAQDWFQQMASMHPPGAVLAVFTHAGVIRALLARALELELSRAPALRIDHGRASAIRFRDGRFEVCYANTHRFESALPGD